MTSARAYAESTLATKTDRVIDFMRSRRYEEALAIASTFRLGMTDGQRRAIVRAHQIKNGSSIYAQMGGCPDAIRQAGIQALHELYGDRL
jgi:hypothetical protein